MTRQASAALALVAVAISLGATTARADGTAVVNPVICALFHGGSTTVPAGPAITVRAGLAEQTLGILTALLNGMTTAVSLNGGQSVDVSSNWLSPIRRADGSWSTTNDYASGVALGPGERLTITYTEVLAHPVPEVFKPALGGEAGQPSFNLAGASVFTCTVTAQA